MKHVTQFNNEQFTNIKNETRKNELILHDEKRSLIKEKFESLKEILYSLNIGNEAFWFFIISRVKIYSLNVNDFSWGCFPILSDNNILIDIRLIVPFIQDEKTLLVNIHEFAHAFELYEVLGNEYHENKAKSENLARSKEQEYLLTRKLKS